MRRRLVALCTLALAPAAQAEPSVVNYVGFAYAHQSNKYESSQVVARFSDWYIGLDSYLIAPMVYAKVSHGFWHAMGSDGKWTVTDKASGQVINQPNDKAAGLSDSFFILLPRLEMGISLGQGKIHPTLGLYLGDSTQYRTDGSSNNESLFYAFDVGLALGVALAAGSEDFGFVVHPTLRFNASFYNQQTRFGDGGGGALEVVAAVKFAKKFAVFIRGGAEGHDLNGNKFYGTQSEEKIHAATAYFHIGVGYSAL